MGATEVSGRLPPEVIQRIVRQHYGRLRMCYEIGLAKNPSLSGRVSVGFTIDRQGGVVRAKDDGSTLRDQGVVSCVKTVFSGLTFPPPEGGMVVVRYPIYFDNGDAGGNTRTRQPVAAVPEAPRPAPEPIFDDEPWDGRFGDVMAELSAGRVELAVARAEHWKKEHPEDFLAWVALGRAYRARGELERAARALGSIVDLWGFRADLRRFVGGELEAIHPTEYLPLAVDSYRHALDDRPDHPSSTLWLAVALMKQGKYAEALKLLEVAHNTRYPDRYRGIHRIFGDVLGICAAAYAKQHPEDDGITRKRLEAMGLWLEDTPTTKLLLTWETDANDVDFHVYDQKGTLAYYAQPVLPAPGGELYADVTEGYGPECFSVPGAPQLGDRRYSLLAHYYRRGPMGAGLGKLEILEHDGHGGVAFESRPYVVTRDGARVSLGDVRFPGTSKAK